jgi:hypothetical protein
MKLLAIINVDFDVMDQLLIRFSAFVRQKNKQTPWPLVGEI